MKEFKKSNFDIYYFICINSTPYPHFRIIYFKNYNPKDRKTLT